MLWCDSEEIWSNKGNKNVKCGAKIFETKKKRKREATK
jgi:hypothetical protein